MADYATFPRRLFTDERFLSLSFHDQAVVARLYLGCDRYGRFPAQEMSLRVRLAVIDGTQLMPSVERIAEAGLCELYDVDGRRFGSLARYDDDLTADMTRKRGTPDYPGPPEETAAPQGQSKGAEAPDQGQSGSAAPAPQGRPKGAPRADQGQTKGAAGAPTTKPEPSLSLRQEEEASRARAHMSAPAPAREATLADWPPPDDWPPGTEAAARAYLSAQQAAAPMTQVLPSSLLRFAQLHPGTFGDAADSLVADAASKPECMRAGPLKWLRARCETGFASERRQQQRARDRPASTAPAQAAEWPEYRLWEHYDKAKVPEELHDLPTHRWPYELALRAMIPPLSEDEIQYSLETAAENRRIDAENARRDAERAQRGAA